MRFWPWNIVGFIHAVDSMSRLAWRAFHTRIYHTIWSFLKKFRSIPINSFSIRIWSDIKSCATSQCNRLPQPPESFTSINVSSFFSFFFIFILFFISILFIFSLFSFWKNYIRNFSSWVHLSITFWTVEWETGEQQYLYLIFTFICIYCLMFWYKNLITYVYLILYIIFDWLNSCA